MFSCGHLGCYLLPGHGQATTISKICFIAGLVNMMMGSDVSLSMAKHMLDLVLLTDTSASYNAALSIIQLLHNADLEIKLEATRRVRPFARFTCTCNMYISL